MYKDKEKQKEAAKAAKARYKAKKQAKEDLYCSQLEITTADGVTIKAGDIPQGIPVGYSAAGIPEGIPQGITEVGILQEDYPLHAFLDLPACVPDSVRDRYARAEPDYVRTINRLVSNSLSNLEAEGVWIPSWRHNAGENLVQTA